MLFRRLWSLLSGQPLLTRRADGSMRVRVAGRVFEAPDEDTLIIMIDRERNRTAERLARARDSVSGAEFRPDPLGGSGFHAKRVAFRETRLLERRLSRYAGFLASIIQEE